MPDTAEMGPRSHAPAAAAPGYTGVFCGRPDQVGQARRAVARYLADCPIAGDATLIASELAANAVVHSSRCVPRPAGSRWRTAAERGGRVPVTRPVRMAWTWSKRWPARATGAWPGTARAGWYGRGWDGETGRGRVGPAATVSVPF